jgi:hypothetical protein
MPAAVTRVLASPFRAGYAHWEAILALHRLCAVAAHSFVADGMVLALMQVTTCVAALVYHVVAKPYSAASANQTQTVLLTLLTAIALLSVPQAVLDTNAGTENIYDQLEHASTVTACFFVAPACTLGLALIAQAWQERRQAAMCCSALGTALVSVACGTGSWDQMASGIVACACSTCWQGISPAPGADPPQELQEQLLGADDGGEMTAGDRNPDSKLVSNSRGLRLTS